jgi:murein DD-endopeptidase MepM/ murein hydrolase activator NlpD
MAWLSVDSFVPASRSGNGSFRLVADFNHSGMAREGIVTVSTGNLSRSVLVGVRQDGNPFNPPVVWPVPTHNMRSNITSRFGTRIHPVHGDVRPHNGVDVRMPTGTRVNAMMAGEVAISEFHPSYGNFVEIRHDMDGGITYTSLYAHLDTRSVEMYQRVSTGGQIGLSGNTGDSTNPHLHFEVRKSGTPINPLDERFDTGTVTTNPNPLFVIENGRYVFNRDFEW